MKTLWYTAAASATTGILLIAGTVTAAAGHVDIRPVSLIGVAVAGLVAVLAGMILACGALIVRLLVGRLDGHMAEVVSLARAVGYYEAVRDELAATPAKRR